LKKLFVVTILSLLVLPNFVSAHSEKDPRHIAMTTLGKHMKSINRGLKAGQITPDMHKQAEEIQAIAGSLANLFPAGEQKHGSRAKPEIWSDAAGFNNANQKFVLAAAAFSDALKSNDVSAAQASKKQTGKTCGGCHKAYRLPKK
jgi:cytochrome c556